MRRGQSHGAGLGSGDVSGIEVKRGHSGLEASSKTKASLAVGILIYFGLVIASFVLGTLVPAQSPSLQPVPHDKRTFCKRQPEPFDPTVAQGKKVLITGAAGFIGSHLARYCAQELEAEVIGLDDFSQGAGNVPFLSDIRILKGNLVNSTFLASIFAKHSFDVIFHTSELSGSSISHHFPSRAYESNVVGTSNLVTHAIKSRKPRFVLVSSTSVYGKAPGPWAETSQTLPTDPYGMLPLPLLFGDGLVVVQTLSGAPVTIHGDGTQQRQFTYVGDVAQLVAQAGFMAHLQYQVVNVGSEEVSSVADVVSEVEAAAGKPLDVANTPVVADAHHVQAVHDRSWCMFDIKGFVPVRDGIKWTLEWAQEAEVDVRPAHHQFHAELVQEGQGALSMALGSDIEVIEATFGASLK